MRRRSASSRTARPAMRSPRGRARLASSRATSSPSCPRPSSACRRQPGPRRRAGEATVRARETTTRAPEETEALGEALGRAARGGELIGLVGELGAGKTCLVRGLARGLGIDPERVHSPSFTIVTEYPGGRLPLTHVDLYRLLGSADDVELLRDALHGPGVAAVEWFDRLPASATDAALVVRLGVTGTTTRALRLEPSDARHEALVAAASSAFDA